MLTYQDLLAIGEDEYKRMQFVDSAINDHRRSDAYKIAKAGDDYFKKRNTTIMEFQKLLYTITGEAVPDNYSANYKLASGFFKRFVTQEVQYLLGNGISWKEETGVEKLGDDFEHQLIVAARNALCGGVAFGFYNLDHIEVYSLTEFVPLYDEENGALMAGVRFWQIDNTKPMRATLYEADGYTDYIWKDSKGEVLNNKRTYKQIVVSSPADGERIYDGENYEGFPIVPLWGNPEHQSELVGIREQIDAYDLIKSGYCNTIDEASIIYWTIQNAGGMDDIDLAKFVERIKTIHAYVAEDDGAKAESHQLEPPFQGRDALLDRIEKDLYRDYMALNTNDIAGGAVTATQIVAAYEPANSKADDFEWCVIDFINEIMRLAGIQNEPTFTRSVIVNRSEEIQTILSASTALDDEYVTRKILTLLGDADQAEEVIERMGLDDYSRMSGGTVDDEDDEDDDLSDLEAELDELLEQLGGDDE